VARTASVAANAVRDGPWRCGRVTHRARRGVHRHGHSLSQASRPIRRSVAENRCPPCWHLALLRDGSSAVSW